MNSVSINPMATSNAAGLFSVMSDGFIQGFAQDDPAIRNELVAGQLLSTETIPMWGGVAISEYLNAAASPNNNMGPNIGRATSNAGITGFSVFNQANHFINTPNSPVPTAGTGMSIPFYRLGSGARIAVACEPSLVSLNAGLVTQQVTWDIANQRLETYKASGATVSVTSVTASYSATTGLWTFAVVAAAASNTLGVGDAINLSGITATGGTAALASLNADQIVTSWTSNLIFSFQIAAAAGAYGAGALSGTIVLNESVGALSCKVLSIHTGNSMIVVYDPVANVATWNHTGTIAIIQI